MELGILADTEVLQWHTKLDIEFLSEQRDQVAGDGFSVMVGLASIWEENVLSQYDIISQNRPIPLESRAFS